VNDTGRPGWPAVLADAAMAVAAGACAMAAFGSAYGGQRYLVVGVIGLLGGAVVGGLGNRFGQPWPLVLGEAVVAYFLIGGPLAAPSGPLGEVLPTPAGLHTLAATAVTGWSGLLATAPVVGNTGHLLVVPVLCGVLCGVATVLTAGRARIRGLALASPLVLLAVAVLFGTAATPSFPARDAILAVVLLSWASWRSRATKPEGVALASRRRPFVASGVLAASGAIGLLVGPILPGSADHLRYVLRDHVPPPFDVHRYPSPLAGYRTYVLPTAEGKTPLFRVSGAPAGSRLRIATLDAYNGIVFSVAAGAPGSSASGNFATVGSPVSPRPCPTTHCTLASITVQLLHYNDVWLPDVGIVRSVHFLGRQAQVQRNDFRYNVATDNAVLAIGAGAPDRYQLVSEVPRVPPPAAMASARAVPAALPTPTGVPKVVGTKATQLAAGASGDFAKAEQLSQHLASEGAYSDGTADSAPSLPGHGQFRIDEFLGLEQPVGDAEQYAAAMDLMARSLGLPARVVLGVRLRPGAHTYVGHDVTAWVEVDFAGVGWYPFDPTPPITAQTRASPPPPPPSSSDQAQYQPPPASPTAGTAAAANATTRARTPLHHGKLLHDLWRVAIVLAAVAVVGLAVLGPPLLVIGLKAARRRRRRSAAGSVARMEGGWAEVIDRARDLRRHLPPRATRRETADALGGSSLAVADRADRATFGPGDPPDADADELWARVDALLAEMEAGLSRWTLLRARVDPRSLLAMRAAGKHARRSERAAR